jgi:hypothetical protein
MSYIGADELVFNNDIENGIHTGGFSVNSIMMKQGLSPIITMNNSQTGGSNNVSDLFNDLVVPNWTLSYHNKLSGGSYKDDSDSDSDKDSVIDDELHDKLLDLVRQHDIKEKKNKKTTRKHMFKNKFGFTKRKFHKK